MEVDVEVELGVKVGVEIQGCPPPDLLGFIMAQMAMAQNELKAERLRPWQCQKA